MPRFDAFCGPANTSVSPNITSEYTMNWIPERNAVSVEGQGTDVHEKNIRCSLIRRPGLKTFVTLPTGIIRGVFPGENRLFAVSGDHFYEIFSNGTFTDRSTPGFAGASGIGPAGGPINNDGKPVLGFFNGTQMLLVSGGQAYCDAGNGPVQCTQNLFLSDLVVDPAPVGGFTFTDLAMVGSLTNCVSSASYTFTSKDVGQPLFISSSTGGWTAGTYTITGLMIGGGGAPNGAAILNTTAGVTGSVGGHATLGLAGTPGYVLTTATGGFFDASDIGRSVQITGGTGFNLITQPILSITANGGAVGASAWGTPGSSLGTGIEQLGKYTLTDLALGGQPNLISSATHPFVQSDVGQLLTVTGGTGFTPGTYTVTALLPGAGGQYTGSAILSAGAGTPGATGGSYTLGSNQVTASYGAFMDGYFFVSGPSSKVVSFSALDVDGGALGWNPLDTFMKHAYPDNVAALYADHEELYTFGDLESTQVWRDVGDANNPFAPDPGAVMHVGCQAPFSVMRLGNGVAWIGLDVRRGTRRAYHAVGYNPVPVSTPAVEAQWAKMSTISDAVAFTYADQGHELWVINFPTGNQTWVYDATTQWWSQWGILDGVGPGGFSRIRPWVHCVVALATSGGPILPDAHYGGDYNTGQVYVMSTAYKTDDGNPIVRRRRAPHLTNENMRRFYARFEIDCDRLGTTRLFWNRLGNGRDRIWQVDTSQNSEAGPVTVTLYWSDDNTQSFQAVFSQQLDPSVDVELANAYLKWTDASWN